MLTKKEVRIIVIIFLVIIAVFGGLYFISFRKLFPPSWRRIFEKEVPPTYTSLGVEIPKKVYAYNGVVENIGEDYLDVRASASNNYLERDTLLKVFFNDETKFARYSLPRGISEETKIIEGHTEAIVFDDVHKGDTVEVFTRGGEKSMSFTADQIKVIVF